MRLYIYDKEFFKANSDVKKAILYAVSTVYTRIKEYEKQNIPFERIFNDEKLKYDKHGEFFTYKQSAYNFQLRILYTYLKVDGDDAIILGDFMLKKKNNKQYIRGFDWANALKASDALLESTLFDDDFDYYLYV